jgi:ATP-grasp in the biosynthetic pathway with Ter operon
MPATVWLNKGLSSTFDVAEMLRDAGAGELRVVCSHPDPDFAASRACDHFEAEPTGLSEAAYVEYCLDFVRRHSVDVFLPGKCLRGVVRQRERFGAAGARLVAAADADTLRTLEDKAASYAARGPDLVPLPDYAVVRDLAGFDAAYARLRAAHRAVCFKPAVSVFGLGFRVVTEPGSGLDRLLSGDAVKIGPDEARRLFAERPTFRDLLVMPYLRGPERSVDCLARDGELLRCVVRRKPTTAYGPQLLEDAPAVADLAARLTRRLRLDGVFNVQFRDGDGVPYLLEINPRMSGGLLYACLSGLCFPYWAVRLALGAAPELVPFPRTGLRVSKVNRAICL